MNREFLLEAVAGLTLALLIAALAVHRTAATPKPGTMRRGAMIAVLLYGILAVGPLIGAGLTWAGALGLLALVCLPVVGMLGATRLGGTRLGATRLGATDLGATDLGRDAGQAGWAGPGGAVAAWARRLVGVGLASAMLVAAGQTLAMIALVDPRAVIVVLAAFAVLLVAGGGAGASSRVGSLAMWLLLVPVAVALGLGTYLGHADQVLRAIIEVPGPSPWRVLALAVALLLIGAGDPGLRAAQAPGVGPAFRVLIGPLVAIVLMSLGLLMFFGGAIIAPSMQFFVVPANVNLVPGLAGALVSVLTVIYLALVMAPLAGLRPGPDGGSRQVVVGGVLAALVALVSPGWGWILLGTAIAASVALVAALLPAPARAMDAAHDASV